MEIQKFEFGEEGLKRVYENDKWMVGIKNWKPANDVANIDCLERHNETDEPNTVTMKSTKLILVEDVSTGAKNSDVLPLSAEQIAEVKRIAR
jgi:hypothetical protein